MKKILCVLTATLMLIGSLAACSGGGQGAATSTAAASTAAESTAPAASTPAAAGGEAYNVVFIPNGMTTESMAFAAKMLQKYAPENGINLTIMDSKNDAQLDTQNINTAIAQGVDAIILNPNDPSSVVPAAMNAQNAGVLLLLFSGDLPEESRQYRDYYCGANDYEAGVKAAEAFIAQFPDGAKVVEVGGGAGYDQQIKRHDGFVDTIEGTNIELIATQNCENWTASDAMNIMQDMIVKEGDNIEGVYCHWDNGLTGVIQAMNDANISPESIYTVAVDGCRAGFDQINDGTQDVTLLQSFENMAKKSLEICRTVLDGGTAEEINYIPWEVVTPENISTYDYPEW